MFIPSDEIIIKASFILSSNENFKSNKSIVACNGERLVSQQELQIYEYLLGFPDLHVEYEKEFIGAEKSLFPDFTVTNVNTGKEYIWEHLGMTNNENYLNRIPAKLEWYKKNGLETIESEGCLIITFYNSVRFYKDVRKFVSLIREAK